MNQYHYAPRYISNADISVFFHGGERLYIYINAHAHLIMVLLNQWTEASGSKIRRKI